MEPNELPYLFTPTARCMMSRVASALEVSTTQVIALTQGDALTVLIGLATAAVELANASVIAGIQLARAILEGVACCAMLALFARITSVTDAAVTGDVLSVSRALGGYGRIGVLPAAKVHSGTLRVLKRVGNEGQCVGMAFLQRVRAEGELPSDAISRARFYTRGMHVLSRRRTQEEGILDGARIVPVTTKRKESQLMHGLPEHRVEVQVNWLAVQVGSAGERNLNVELTVRIKLRSR